MNRIASYITDHQDRFLAELADLCRIPSVMGPAREPWPSPPTP